MRRGGYIFADHLVGGVSHPDEFIAPKAAEFKNGARTMKSMTVTEQELVVLRLGEEAEKDAYEDELRDKERQANAGR